MEIIFLQGRRWLLAHPWGWRRSRKIPIHLESRNRLESTSHCAAGHENICNPFSRANFPLTPPLLSKIHATVPTLAPLQNITVNRAHNSRGKCGACGKRIFQEARATEPRSSLPFPDCVKILLPQPLPPLEVTVATGWNEQSSRI